MPDLSYPPEVLPRLRYQSCPLCRADLIRKLSADDGILRTVCSECDWIHYPGNAVGVNVIVESDGGVVAILPPDSSEDEPAALPGGHVEYGESPEDAAVREAREETGLDVEVVMCLGWYFEKQDTYPGPIVSFVFVASATAGELKGSEEGRAQVFPIGTFPAISPARGGSRRAMELYLESRT